MDLDEGTLVHPLAEKASEGLSSRTCHDFVVGPALTRQSIYGLDNLVQGVLPSLVVLALIRKRLPEDWTARYNTTPVFVETLIETPRHTGAVYRAAGWIRVGTTQGRGRYDRYRKFDKPRKDIWPRPLRKDSKRTLNR